MEKLEIDLTFVKDGMDNGIGVVDNETEDVGKKTDEVIQREETYVLDANQTSNEKGNDIMDTEVRDVKKSYTFVADDPATFKEETFVLDSKEENHGRIAKTNSVVEKNDDVIKRGVSQADDETPSKRKKSLHDLPLHPERTFVTGTAVAKPNTKSDMTLPGIQGNPTSKLPVQPVREGTFQKNPDIGHNSTTKSKMHVNSDQRCAGYRVSDSDSVNEFERRIGTSVDLKEVAETTAGPFNEDLNRDGTFTKDLTGPETTIIKEATFTKLSVRPDRTIGGFTSSNSTAKELPSSGTDVMKEGTFIKPNDQEDAFPGGTASPGTGVMNERTFTKLSELSESPNDTLRAGAADRRNSDIKGNLTEELVEHPNEDLLTDHLSEELAEKCFNEELHQLLELSANDLSFSSLNSSQSTMPMIASSGSFIIVREKEKAIDEIPENPGESSESESGCSTPLLASSGNFDIEKDLLRSKETVANASEKCCSVPEDDVALAHEDAPKSSPIRASLNSYAVDESDEVFPKGYKNGVSINEANPEGGEELSNTNRFVRKTEASLEEAGNHNHTIATSEISPLPFSPVIADPIIDSEPSLDPRSNLSDAAAVKPRRASSQDSHEQHCVTVCSGEDDGGKAERKISKSKGKGVPKLARRSRVSIVRVGDVPLAVPLDDHVNLYEGNGIGTRTEGLVEVTATTREEMTSGSTFVNGQAQRCNEYGCVFESKSVNLRRIPPFRAKSENRITASKNATKNESGDKETVHLDQRISRFLSSRSLFESTATPHHDNDLEIKASIQNGADVSNESAKFTRQKEIGAESNNTIESVTSEITIERETTKEAAVFGAKPPVFEASNQSSLPVGDNKSGPLESPSEEPENKQVFENAVMEQESTDETNYDLKKQQATIKADLEKNGCDLERDDKVKTSVGSGPGTSDGEENITSIIDISKNQLESECELCNGKESDLKLESTDRFIENPPTDRHSTGAMIADISADGSATFENVGGDFPDNDRDESKPDVESAVSYVGQSAVMQGAENETQVDSLLETAHLTSKKGSGGEDIGLSDQHIRSRGNEFGNEGEPDHVLSTPNSDMPTDIEIDRMDTTVLDMDKGLGEMDYVIDSDSLNDCTVEEVDYIKDSDSVDISDMKMAPDLPVSTDIPASKDEKVSVSSPSGDNVNITQRESHVSARGTSTSSFEGPGPIPHRSKSTTDLEERRSSVALDAKEVTSKDSNVTVPTPYAGFVANGTRKESSVSHTDESLTKSNFDVPTTERSRSMTDLVSDGSDVISDQMRLAKYMVADSILASLDNLDRVEGNTGTEPINIDADGAGSVQSSKGATDTKKGVAYSKKNSVNNRFRNRNVPKNVLTRLESAVVFDTELVDDPDISKNRPDWELIMVATKEPSMDDPIDYRCDVEPGDERSEMTPTDSRGMGSGSVDDYQKSDIEGVMTTDENGLNTAADNDNVLEKNTKCEEGLAEIDKKSSGSDGIDKNTKLVSGNKEDRLINAVNYTSDLEPTVEVDLDYAASDESLGADVIGGRGADVNDHVTRPLVKQKTHEGLERRTTLSLLSVGEFDVSEALMGVGSCGMAMAAVGRYRRLSSGTPYNPPKLKKGYSCPEIVVTSPPDLQDERNYEEFLRVLNELKAQREQDQQRQLMSKSLYTLSEERSIDLLSDVGQSSEKTEADTEKTESDTEIAEGDAESTEAEKEKIENIEESHEMYTEMAESQKAHDTDYVNSAADIRAVADDSEQVEGKLQTGCETDEREESTEVVLAKNGEDSVRIDGNAVKESDVMLVTNANDNISTDSNIMVEVTDEFEDGPLDLPCVSVTELRFGEGLHTLPPGIVIQSPTPNQSIKSQSITPNQGADSDDVIKETSSPVKKAESVNSYVDIEISTELDTSGEYPEPGVAVEGANTDVALSNKSRGSPCPPSDAEVFVNDVSRESSVPVMEAEKLNSQSGRVKKFQSHSFEECLVAPKTQSRRSSLNFVEFIEAEAVGVDVSQYMSEVHEACDNIQGENVVDLNEGACVLKNDGDGSTHEQQENMAYAETIEKGDGNVITPSCVVDEITVENQNTGFRTSSFGGLSADDEKPGLSSEAPTEREIRCPTEKPEVVDAILKLSAEQDQDDQSEGDVVDLRTVAPVSEMTSRETDDNEKLRGSDENYETGGIWLHNEDYSSDNKEAKISAMHDETSAVTMETGQTVSDENKITETIKETVNQLFGQIESGSTANLETGGNSMRVDETPHDATAKQEIANADDRGVTTQETDDIKEFKVDILEHAVERQEDTTEKALERPNQIKIIDFQKSIEHVTAGNINNEGQNEAGDGDDLETESDVMIAPAMDTDVRNAAPERETTLNHSHSLHVLESPNLLEDIAQNKLPQGLDAMKEINLEERHMHEEGARVSRPQTAVDKMTTDEEGKDFEARGEKRTVTTRAVVHSHQAMPEEVTTSDELQATGSEGHDTHLNNDVEDALGDRSTVPELEDGKAEIGNATIEASMMPSGHAVGDVCSEIQASREEADEKVFGSYTEPPRSDTCGDGITSAAVRDSTNAEKPLRRIPSITLESDDGIQVLEPESPETVEEVPEAERKPGHKYHYYKGEVYDGYFQLDIDKAKVDSTSSTDTVAVETGADAIAGTSPVDRTAVVGSVRVAADANVGENQNDTIAEAAIGENHESSQNCVADVSLPGGRGRDGSGLFDSNFASDVSEGLRAVSCDIGPVRQQSIELTSTPPNSPLRRSRENTQVMEPSDEVIGANDDVKRKGQGQTTSEGFGTSGATLGNSSIDDTYFERGRTPEPLAALSRSAVERSRNASRCSSQGEAENNVTGSESIKDSSQEFERVNNSDAVDVAVKQLLAHLERELELEQAEEAKWAEGSSSVDVDEEAADLPFPSDIDSRTEEINNERAEDTVSTLTDTKEMTLTDDVSSLSKSADEPLPDLTVSLETSTQMLDKSVEFEGKCGSIDLTKEAEGTGVSEEDTNKQRNSLDDVLKIERDGGELSHGDDMVQTEPGLDLTESGLDHQTEPGLDLKESGLDQTESGLDQTETGLDLTEPGLGQTEPGQDQIEPSLDQTEPGQDQESGLRQTEQGQDQTESGLVQTESGLDQTKVEVSRVGNVTELNVDNNEEVSQTEVEAERERKITVEIVDNDGDLDQTEVEAEIADSAREGDVDSNGEVGLTEFKVETDRTSFEEIVCVGGDVYQKEVEAGGARIITVEIVDNDSEQDQTEVKAGGAGIVSDQTLDNDRGLGQTEVIAREAGIVSNVTVDNDGDEEAPVLEIDVVEKGGLVVGDDGIVGDEADTDDVAVSEGRTDPVEYVNEHNNDISATGHFGNDADEREATDENISMPVNDSENGAETMIGVEVESGLDDLVEETGKGKPYHELTMPGALAAAGFLGDGAKVAEISDTEAELTLHNGGIGQDDLESDEGIGEKVYVSNGLETEELQNGELLDSGESAIQSSDADGVVEETFTDEQRGNRSRRVPFEENAVFINSSGELGGLENDNVESKMATADKSDDNDVIGMVKNGDGELARENGYNLEARPPKDSDEKTVDILKVEDDIMGSEDDDTGSEEGMYENDFEELVSEDERKKSEPVTFISDGEPALNLSGSGYFITGEVMRTPCGGNYFDSDIGDGLTPEIIGEDREQTVAVIDASEINQETGRELGEDVSLHKIANEFKTDVSPVSPEHQPDLNVLENVPSPAEVDLNEFPADNGKVILEETSVLEEKTEIDSVPEVGSHIEPEEQKSGAGDGPAEPAMISSAADDFGKGGVRFEDGRRQSGDGHSSPGSPREDEHEVHKGYLANDEFDVQGENSDDVNKNETFKMADADLEEEASGTSREKFVEHNLGPVSVDKNIIEPEVDKASDSACPVEGELKFEHLEVRGEEDTGDGFAHAREEGVTDENVEVKNEIVDKEESATSRDQEDENAMLHLLRKDDEVEFRPVDGGNEIDLRNKVQEADDKVTENMIEMAGDSKQDALDEGMLESKVEINNESGSEQEPEMSQDENAMSESFGKDDEFVFRPTEEGVELDLRNVVSTCDDKVTEKAIETSGAGDKDGSFDHIAPRKLKVDPDNKENMAAAKVSKARPIKERQISPGAKAQDTSVSRRSPRIERQILAKTPERSPPKRSPVMERKPLTKIQPLPPGKLPTRPSRLRQNIRVLPRPVKGQSQQYRKSEFLSRDPCIVGPKKAEEGKGDGKGNVMARNRSPVKSPWGPRHTEERSKVRRTNLEDVQFELKVKAIKVPNCTVSPYAARMSRSRLNSNRLPVPGSGKSPGSCRSPARHDDLRSGDDVRTNDVVIGELRHDATELEDVVRSNDRSPSPGRASPGRAWIEKELEAIHARRTCRGSTARFPARKRPEAPTPSAKGHLSKSAEPVTQQDNSLRASGAKTAPLLRRAGPNSYRRRLYRPATNNIIVPEQGEAVSRLQRSEDMTPLDSDGGSGARPKYLPHPPNLQLRYGRGKSKDQNKQNTPKSGGTTPRKEEDKKQKEYFRNELKRLQTSLQRESSKIKAPPVKPHFPYVFTNLAPYYNTYTASYLIDTSEEVPVSRGYMMRKTAIGLCDPWDDLRMDREMLPRIERRLPRPLDKKKQSQKNRDKGEGSTRLPKFPAVELDTRDLATRKLNYDDVRMLRNKLREKYSANAGAKVDEDYKRTKQDYHRMELDRLDQVHPSNRSHMKSAYFAYLRNTPGSKRAINECVKKTEEELQEEEKERQRKENEQQKQQPVEAKS